MGYVLLYELHLIKSQDVVGVDDESDDDGCDITLMMPGDDVGNGTDDNDNDDMENDDITIKTILLFQCSKLRQFLQESEKKNEQQTEQVRLAIMQYANYPYFTINKLKIQSSVSN